MKHLRLFETEADYTAAILDLPVISYVKKTGNVYYNGKHAVDRVLNAPLMNMCVANGWAKESTDYLTYEEAATVSSIDMTDFATYEVVSAWELKYFTGITSFVQSSVQLPLIEYFYIPDTYTGLFSHAYTGANGYLFPNIKKYHISDSMTTLRNERVKGWEDNGSHVGSIVYVGKNIDTTSGSPVYPLCQFETVIFAAEPLVLNPDNISYIGAQRVFIADENVETLKTLEPFKRYTNSIFPLSEYNGDPDY